eukprot:29026-Pelagococcus_subviridis.AAC.12
MERRETEARRPVDGGVVPHAERRHVVLGSVPRLLVSRARVAGPGLGRAAARARVRVLLRRRRRAGRGTDPRAMRRRAMKATTSTTISAAVAFAARVGGRRPRAERRARDRGTHRLPPRTRGGEFPARSRAEALTRDRDARDGTRHSRTGHSVARQRRGAHCHFPFQVASAKAHFKPRPPLRGSPLPHAHRRTRTLQCRDKRTFTPFVARSRSHRGSTSVARVDRAGRPGTRSIAGSAEGEEKHRRP